MRIYDLGSSELSIKVIGEENVIMLRTSYSAIKVDVESALSICLSERTQELLLRELLAIRLDQNGQRKTARALRAIDDSSLSFLADLLPQVVAAMNVEGRAVSS